jgi:PAS domain S-box-containing protein
LNKLYNKIFLENINPILIVNYKNWKITEVNKSACKLYGYSKEEFIGLAFKKLLPQNEQKRFSSILKQLPVNKSNFKKRFSGFWEHIKKNNEYLYIKIKLDFIDDEQKNQYQCFVSINDETNKIITEKKYKQLTDATTEAVVIHDNGIIQNVNKSFLKKFGYKLNEVIGKSVLQFTAPQSKKELINKIKSGFVDTYRAYGITKKGKEFLCELTPREITYFGKKIRVVCIRDISEEYKKNLKLKESERFLSSILKNLPGVFYRCLNDKDWTMLFITKNIKKISGYSPELFLSKKINYNDLIVPEYKNYVWTEIQKAIKNKTFFYLTYPILNKYNKQVWIQEQGAPVYDEKNNLIGLEGYLNDITKQYLLEQQKIKIKIIEENNKALFKEIEQRKKIEQQLIQEKNFTTDLINSSLDVIMAANNKGIITKVNKICYDVFGYTPNELIGKKVNILYANKNQYEKVRKQLKEFGFYKGEVLNKHKTGKFFTSYLSASVIKDENGKIVGTMGVSRDITEQKRNELLLKQREENYRNLFNKAYIGFAKISLYGVIIESNPHFKEIFGLQTDKQYSFKDILYSEDYEFILEKFKELFYKKVDNITEELVCKHTNGSDITIKLTLSISLNEEKKPEYFVALIEDITRKKKNEEKIFLQASRLNAVFESSAHIIWTINKNGILTSFNSKFSETIYSFFGKIIDPFKTNLNDLFSDLSTFNLWKENYKIAFSGQITQFQTKINDKNNNIHWYEIFLYPIFNLKLDVFEVSALGNNITDRKINEQKLTQTIAKLNSIVESSSHIIFTINSQLIITSFNQKFKEEIQKHTSVNVELYKTKLSNIYLFFNENNTIWQQALTNGFTGKPINFEYDFINNKGEIIWYDVFIEPIKTSTNLAINEVSVIAHDITEKKLAIDKSLLHAARIRSIFQNSSLMIYTIDKKYCLMSFNENYAQFIKTYFGYNIYEGFNILKVYNTKIYFSEYKRLLKFHQFALKGNSVTFESKVKISDEYRWFESHLDPIILPNGTIEGVTYITRDISDKKEAEQKLIESGYEKEILLKEIHHRVKNNLQVISSILSLQSTHTNDTGVLNIIKESQNRIKSMSFIHETLYQTNNFSSIHFGNYLKNIVKNLVHTYFIKEGKVFIEFDTEDIELDLDTSIPCGLIVNELVSNAFKYAYDGIKNPKLIIKLKKCSANEILIGVKDNGKGLPKNFNINEPSTLGLQLVMALCNQIEAKLEWKISNGTEFIIIFKNKFKR